MLVWSKSARIAIWAVVVPLFLVVYGLPIGVILLASITRTWNNVLPSALTLDHYAAAFQGDSLASLTTSLMTGLIASVVALVSGAWAALALRRLPRRGARVLDAVFFVPSAVPSVSVGLGLLVAFSQKPLLLNGTPWIVLVAHFVLVSAFTYGNLRAGLARIPVECEAIAESLGARPFYRLRRVTLPLLSPYLISAFSLSFALSMGELGATIMIYPPGWVTLPVQIFALSDRGAIFDAATLTALLGFATLIVLTGLSRLSARSMTRNG
ncbi:MAG TPA: ABC transporter permease subunit [Acidisoma sp.]|jgi:2-aminoethylphosphonate transport system permease protein|uniref:ABC transporter permease subunit n=1 Tax=Acidisoma sp. TaxID=1872115 RepID=UPI002CCA3078|nr:ABC transporter permease subunit [Acidisoma sp.]HTI00044.1 ABC transporter permease subunit [Acidisoma sp.]